ncbi:MAG TPA: helix-turn-helix transcriptional regulator [Bacillota bacterium]|nr:helix-turn-helix transcriptional regulator [Bacillota bacterium]
MIEISEKIKKLRTAKNWSQEELAKRIGVAQQYISKYESGKTKPSYKILQKLAYVLEEPVEYLITPENPAMNDPKVNDKELLNLLAKLEHLDAQDLITVKHMVEAMIAKKMTNTD